MREIVQSWRQEPRLGKLQYSCLLAVVLLEWFFLSPWGQRTNLAWVLVERFLQIPALVFLLLSVARGASRKGRSTLVLGILVLLWFSVAQILRGMNSVDKVAWGPITCSYALALPLAYATDDAGRQRGLNTLFALFLLEGIRLCVYAAALKLGFLPRLLSANVCWVDSRLQQLAHPNTCAATLMLGMGVSLALCFRVKNRWLRLALIALAAAQFAAQALTDSRTSTIFACLMAGGIAFCAIRKTGWKRIPLALAAGVLVMAALFLTSEKLYDLHRQSMAQAALQTAQVRELSAQEEEPAPPPEAKSGQEAPGVRLRSYKSDLPTLNNRTVIWEGAIKGALHHPTILLYGTDSAYDVILEESGFPGEHTHNSFLEMLYTLGLPGLLLVLAVAVLAVRSAAILLWRNTDLWKSSVAVIAMCLFGCGMLEPYLFAPQSSQHFLSLFFLAAAGYLCQWCVKGGSETAAR